MLETTNVIVLQLAHNLLEKDKREIIFEVENATTTGLKFDLSNDSDAVQFRKIAWLAESRYYEEELIGKTLKAIVSRKNGKVKIKAIGNRKEDCFIIINGNDEVVSHQKALSLLNKN